MRSVRLTALFLFFVIAAGAQTTSDKDKNDLAKDKIKGKVKTMAVTNFTVVRRNGKLQKGRVVHVATSHYNQRGNIVDFVSTAGDDTVQDQFVHFKAIRNHYLYDNNGILTNTSRYNGDGKLEDSVAYKVDSKGNRIDWNTYNGDGSLEWNYNREYDLQGHLIETNENHKGVLKSRHTYKYDDKLNIKEENYYEGDGRLKQKELFKYDEKRNVTEIMAYNSTGVFKAKYTYAYDSRGNQIEEREYNQEDGTKHKKIITKYDDENNVIDVTQYNEKGKTTYQCKVDKIGNHTYDATYRPDGTLLEKVTQVYKYDEHGSEVENERFNAKGKSMMKIKNIYTYDKEGNWFIKIVYENDKPKRITERIFDYY